MPFPFDAYLKSIQKNLQKGSKRSYYPALKDLLDDRTIAYLPLSLMKCSILDEMALPPHQPY